MTGAQTALALLASSVLQAQGYAATLAVTHLEAQAAAEPLGLADAAPRLSWAMTGDGRGLRQRAFRVLVASQPELVREGKADVWDSREVASPEPAVVYAGPALASRTRYYWSVRVWAEGSLSSGWAPPTWFETGFLAASVWKGQWIAGPERPEVRTAAEGEADDAAIRAAGELCRPVSWLTQGFAAARIKNDQGECRELRPAPRLRKSFRIAKPVARA